MQILVIEPVGFLGHININAFFLRCLEEIGKITFVAPVGYLKSYHVDSRIDIPTKLLQHKSKLGARWSAVRILDFILNNICLNNYDVIVFLAYETISFSLRWPKERQVFLFEHNNIENTLGSQIKMFFYRHLSPNVIHLAFQNHIAQYIRITYGSQVVCVPHPYYRPDVSDSGACREANATPRTSERVKIIFSPSGSTPPEIQDELKKFTTTTKGSYYAICKDQTTTKTEDWEGGHFFENYENLMRSCYMVFLGAYFHYRVSGVAYEALSYGKPIVLFDCPFARELHKENPHMVFLIKDMNDILRMEINQEKINEDHKHFLRDHSFDTIQKKMKSVFFAQNTKG